MQKATTSKDNAWTFWLCAVCALAGWCWDDAEAQHEPERQWVRVDLSAHLKVKRHQFKGAHALPFDLDRYLQTVILDIDVLQVLPYDDAHAIVFWRQPGDLSYSPLPASVVLVRLSDGAIIDQSIDIPWFVRAVSLGQRRVLVINASGWFVLHSGEHDNATLYHDFGHFNGMPLATTMSEGDLWIAWPSELSKHETIVASYAGTKMVMAGFELITPPTDKDLSHISIARCGGLVYVLHVFDDEIWMRSMLGDLNEPKIWKKLPPPPGAFNSADLACSGEQAWVRAVGERTIWVKKVDMGLAELPWEEVKGKEVEGEEPARMWLAGRGGLMLVEGKWLVYRVLDIEKMMWGEAIEVKQLQEKAVVDCDDDGGAADLRCAVFGIGGGQKTLEVFFFQRPTTSVSAASPVLKLPPNVEVDAATDLYSSCKIDLPDEERAAFTKAVDHYCKANPGEAACSWLPARFAASEPSAAELAAQDHFFWASWSDDVAIERLDLSPCVLSPDESAARKPFDLLAVDWFAGRPENSPVDTLPIGLSWSSLHFEPAGDSDWTLVSITQQPVLSDTLHITLINAVNDYCGRIPSLTDKADECYLMPSRLPPIPWFAERFAVQLEFSEKCKSWEDLVSDIHWIRYGNQKWGVKGLDVHGCDEDCH